MKDELKDSHINNLSDEKDIKNPNPTDELNNNTNMADDEQHSTENNSDDTNNESQDLLSKLGFKNKDSKLKKENAELKQKVEELNDQYLRLMAEFDNARKRNTKERIELFKTAGQDVIQAMLPVLDDFDRAVKQMETAHDINAVKEGVLLIQNKMKSILEHRGLQEMKSIGNDFNVEHHEAITEVPAPDENMKGKVIDEVEKGYSLNDKIIRFAKVIVGK
jgi:molecular chaperone GrpE